ncbi:Aste57867_14308 [Aphanomyces stellatus]|uniref:Choline transporter-like protein n=1 Tax=Aphanomyces stellatus TaxID=120398 RepID=A0A485L1E1_9STRA|nr:hypothetical protein As57867_014255 [Aphanomyces stellatus]VFT91133.1 Aste57867_14308 [Aphanomyces stellatus]
MYQNKQSTDFDTRGKQAHPVDVYGNPVPMAAPVAHTGNASNGAVAPMKPTASAPSGFRDWPFAILFVLNIGAIIVLLVMYGTTLLKKSDGTTSSKTFSNVISDSNMKTVLAVSGALSVIAAALSFVMLSLTVRFARMMIQVSLWFSVVLCFASCAFAAVKGQYVLAAVCGLIGLLSVCYAYAVQDRIPFAVANLRAAGAAIRKHPSTYLVAFLFLIIQIVWVFAWSISVVGISNKLTETTDSSVSTGTLAIGRTCSSNAVCASNNCVNRQCSEANTFSQLKGSSYAAYFFLLVSLYWGVQVFSNIIHATVAGTVATWWFSQDSKGATGASLGRATTTSLGSICLGSLIVAVLQALRTLAQEARSQGDWLACIAECILNCLQSLMEVFNRWAFVYVGIYGYKFTDAGRAVMTLFQSRGFDAIINDDLISNALGFASFGVGCLCALLGLAYNYINTANQFQYSEIIFPFIGLFFGIGISLVPLGVVDSAVATVYVCFAEDPVALQHSHTEHYNELMTEWHRKYPEIMVASGYYVVA